MSTNAGYLNFSPLLEQPRSWKTFCASYGLQALAALVLIQISLWQPMATVTQRAYQYVALASPELQPAPKPAEPQPVVRQARYVPQPARVAAALPEPKPVVQIKVPEPLHRIQPPQPQMAPVRILTSQVMPNLPLAKPAAIVRTGGFSAGSSATPTIQAPVEKVQTGGFGDPNGVPAQNSPNKAGAAIAQVGSFDLPEGAGNGNGAGGARGIRGVVASAGFGNGIATQNPVAAGRGNGMVQQANFAATRVADTPHPRQLAAAPAMTAVEIISKPKPTYTEEARQLHLEGEVLVEVVFTASGEVHAVRVVRGLGHGLDEAALRAAERIQFKPAQRDGHAVDSSAILHVVFQIA